jgi:hypothetical protein
MGRPKGSKNKVSKYEALDLEFRSKVEGSNEEQIRQLVSQIAFNELENQLNKKADEDLASLQAQAKEAALQYTDGTKANKLKISYCYAMLESRKSA